MCPNRGARQNGGLFLGFPLNQPQKPTLKIHMQLFHEGVQPAASLAGLSWAAGITRVRGLREVYWLMRLHGDGLQSFVYGVGTARPQGLHPLPLGQRATVNTTGLGVRHHFWRAHRFGGK